MAQIVGRHTLASEEIGSIDIETYSIAKSLTGHIATEDSEPGAKFSTPIAIGLLLVFGQSDSSIYKKHYISDPLVQFIAQKVRMHVTPERDKAYPQHRGARVTVNIGDRSYSQEVINAVWRCLLAGTALMLIIPGLVTDLIGFSVLLIFLFAKTSLLKRKVPSYDVE